MENMDNNDEQHYTDLGNARRLIERHGEQVRYVREWGWLVWDGKRWKRDDTGQVMEAAKETVLSLYADAATMAENDARRRKYVEHAERSESRYKLEAMVKLAETDPTIAATPDQFDTDVWLLNVQNGTIDLRTGELRAHNPHELITKVAARNYDPDASSAVWEQFLADVFQDDAEMIGFMQRTIGYTLTGSTHAHAFYIAWGSGRNGKSTLFGAVGKVLGDYAATTPAQTILHRDRAGGIPNDIAALAGSRMVTVSETDSGMALNVGLVKQLTGGDPVTARFLYKEAFTFQPQMKFWLMTNNKPDIPESTRAIWARIKLIPFENDFTGREDTQMDTKLSEAGDAILAWAVDGCLRGQREGLREPPKVHAATQSYKEEQDLLAEFVDETCDLEAGLEVKARMLYKAYQDWCLANQQMRPMSEKDFSNQMQQRGIRKVKKSGMYYLDIGLKSPSPNVHPFPTIIRTAPPPWQTSTGTDDEDMPF
jgi:putative DNA primase/helicase